MWADSELDSKISLPRCYSLIARFELAWQLLFVSIVEDAGFYWAHRLSHEFKFLYKYHKIHHEYTEVFSLVTEYTHPIDYIIGILVWSCWSRFPQLYPSLYWVVGATILCSFCGKCGRFSSARRDTAGTTSPGAPPGFSSSFRTLHSTTTTIATMWAIIAEAFTCGISGMDPPTPISSTTGSTLKRLIPEMKPKRRPKANDPLDCGFYLIIV